MPASKRFLAKTTALLMGMASIVTPGVANAETWTFPVARQDPPGVGVANAKNTQTVYQSLEKAEKPWRICVSHPHLADTYHLALNYGYTEEAKRLGVEVQVVEAGGYDKLQTQISQVEDCVTQGADAVILIAISGTGVESLVAELDAKGIPVIDLLNGIPSPKVKAHVLTTYYDIGKIVGNYVAARHPAGSKIAKVVWHPGPGGSGWAEDQNKGFLEATAGSAIEVLATRYANTNKPTQLKLIEDELTTFPEIDYWIGVAPGVEAAAGAVREAGRESIRLIANYQTPETVDMVNDGKAFGVLVDSPVYQGRIALDETVRVLEKREYIPHVNPNAMMIDASNIKTWDRLTSLPPKGWAPVFHVGPKD
jgi:protein TorT